MIDETSTPEDEIQYLKGAVAYLLALCGAIADQKAVASANGRVQILNSKGSLNSPMERKGVDWARQEIAGTIAARAQRIGG